MATSDRRRLVPRTDAVLADPRLLAAAKIVGRARVKQAVVDTLARVRAGAIEPATAADEAVWALSTSGDSAGSAGPVVNATGVVLHTNLGRAALSPAAVAAVADAAGYVDVEYDLATGRRAARGRTTLDALARAVPVAGGVHVVNNGAAALVLATTAFAAGREVVVSRGEMVEIGDGFRLPDLIRSTGVVLREVGTTNRVTAADYQAAISERTGAVLKVHPSNFTIAGFTRAVEVAELTRLGVAVIVDVGSGLLAPDSLLPDEPDVTTALRAGAAIVTCSGDKLLGGPQAGLLFGRAEAIERLRRHPLARALRVDKLTLAALEATLNGPGTPTWRYLRADTDELRERCERLVAELVDRAGVDARVVASKGVVGGGGAPGVVLAGWAVSLPAGYVAPLRQGRPAIIGRVENDRALLDLRCVDPVDDAELGRATLAVAAAAGAAAPDEAG